MISCSRGRGEGLTDGASFRDLTPQDVDAGLVLCRASGWNQTDADWTALIEPPSVFRAAVIEGRVVGSAGAVIYGRAIAWVCMVLVDPAFRGRGLASRLVGEVLERLAGFDVVGLDATPQGRPVYARLGFAEGYGLARMEAGPRVTTGLPPPGTATSPRSSNVAWPISRSTPATNAHRTHAPSVRALHDDDWSTVLPWDETVFGADRRRLLRFLQASAPEYAWVLDEGGRIDAYCFGRHGQIAEQIGPVVARRPEAARTLIEGVLARHPDRRFFMDVTTAEPWTSMVSAMGFRELRPFTRMYRAGRVPAQPPPGLYAVLGPEFG